MGIHHNHLTKIDKYIAIWGGAVSLIALPWGGQSAFVSTLVGAFLALGNWMIFRYLASRMVSAGNQAGFGLFLGIKTLAILVIISVLCLKFPLNPVSVIVGFSALVLGIVTFVFKGALLKGHGAVEKEL